MVKVSGSLLQSRHDISSIKNLFIRTSLIGSTFQAIFHQNKIKSLDVAPLGMGQPVLSTRDNYPVNLIVIKWCRVVRDVRELFEKFSELVTLVRVDKKETILIKGDFGQFLL